MKYKFKGIKQGESVEIPTVKELDMEIMLKRQVELKTTDPIYASYQGMKAMAGELLKRIDKTVKIEELDMVVYSKFIDAIITENPELFGTNKNFHKADK